VADQLKKFSSKMSNMENLLNKILAAIKR